MNLLESAIVNPVKRKDSPDIGPVSVMVATQPDINLLLNSALLTNESACNLFCGKLYRGTEATAHLSVAGPFVGVPYAVMVLETLIAWGVRRVIFWGWCGAVSDRVQIGDIVIPSGAIVDEGTSNHYAATEKEIVYPSTMMVQKISKALASNHTDFHEGLVWTTDAVFRETREKVLYYKTRGALAVDMEMSALFTVAAFRRVEIGGILVVSDDLSHLEWKPGFKSTRFREGRMEAGKAVQSVCKELTG